MRIQMDLVRALDEGATIQQLCRTQHRYHEWRRWSVFDILAKHRGNRAISKRDHAALWHVGRGELTTLPAGVGLAETALQMARSLEETNPRGAKVLHAAGYWLGRYWNEEEAHHEVAYGALLDELCLDPIPDEDVMSHRGMFPRDNFLRNLVLQACVEIEVSITYANAAKTTDNPMIREIFLQIMRDEVQHRQYFVAFAQALVDAGVYPAKDALAMAFHWIKPGGELYGSTRSAQSSRDGYVNWWEMTRTGDDDVAVTDDQHFDERILSQKRTSVLKVASQSTRTHYDSVAGLKKAYLRALAPRPELVAGVSP